MSRVTGCKLTAVLAPVYSLFPARSINWQDHLAVVTDSITVSLAKLRDDARNGSARHGKSVRGVWIGPR